MVRSISKEYGLILNEKKSAILIIKGNKSETGITEIEGIPILNEYCYLGVLIDNFGRLKP